MSRDLRRYSRQTTGRLVVGFALLLVLVGGGLIYLFYGPEAAATSLLCLMAALLPLSLIWLIMGILGWIVKRSREV